MSKSVKPIKEEEDKNHMEKTATYTSTAPSLTFQPLPQLTGTNTVPITRVEKPKLILIHRGGRYRLSTLNYSEFGRDDFKDAGPMATYISHRHFALMYTAEKLYIKDLGSKNGTYVNGRDIRNMDWVELKPGDIVKILNLEFEVVENK